MPLPFSTLSKYPVSERYRRLRKQLPAISLSAVLVLTLNGCGKQGEDTPPAPVDAIPAPAPMDNQPLRQTTERVWQQVDTQLTQCQQDAHKLNQGIDNLLKLMDEVSLSDAKNAWHTSHNCLQQLTPFLLLGDVSPGLFGPMRELAFNVDAWPIQPGYLDYFDVYPHSGIVNDIAVPLTASALRGQHGFSDNSDVSLGFHAIAYLLWGEEGQRPPTDFIADGTVTEKQKASGLTPVDLPNSRRRTLLKLQGQLLLDDLKNLQQQLHPATNTLSLAYQRLSPQSRLQLWQRVAEYQIKSDVMDTQVSILAAGEGLPEGHNQFAGHTSESLVAGLQGLENLLFGLPVEDGTVADPTLVSFLLEEQEQQALKQALDKAQQQFEALADDWPAVGEKRLKPLLQALSDAAALLTPRATAESSATESQTS